MGCTGSKVDERATQGAGQPPPPGVMSPADAEKMREMQRRIEAQQYELAESQRKAKAESDKAAKQLEEQKAQLETLQNELSKTKTRAEVELPKTVDTLKAELEEKQKQLQHANELLSESAESKRIVKELQDRIAELDAQLEKERALSSLRLSLQPPKSPSAHSSRASSIVSESGRRRRGGQMAVKVDKEPQSTTSGEIELKVPELESLSQALATLESKCDGLQSPDDLVASLRQIREKLDHHVIQGRASAQHSPRLDPVEGGATQDQHRMSSVSSELRPVEDGEVSPIANAELTTDEVVQRHLEAKKEEEENGEGQLNEHQMHRAERESESESESKPQHQREEEAPPPPPPPKDDIQAEVPQERKRSTSVASSKSSRSDASSSFLAKEDVAPEPQPADDETHEVQHEIVSEERPAEPVSQLEEDHDQDSGSSPLRSDDEVSEAIPPPPQENDEEFPKPPPLMDQTLEVTAASSALFSDESTNEVHHIVEGEQMDDGVQKGDNSTTAVHESTAEDLWGASPPPVEPHDAFQTEFEPSDKAQASPGAMQQTKDESDAESSDDSEKPEPIVHYHHESSGFGNEVKASEGREDEVVQPEPERRRSSSQASNSSKSSPSSFFSSPAPKETEEEGPKVVENEWNLATMAATTHGFGQNDGWNEGFTTSHPADVAPTSSNDFAQDGSKSALVDSEEAGPEESTAAVHESTDEFWSASKLEISPIPAENAGSSATVDILQSSPIQAFSIPEKEANENVDANINDDSEDSQSDSSSEHEDAIPIVVVKALKPTDVAETVEDPVVNQVQSQDEEPQDSDDDFFEQKRKGSDSERSSNSAPPSDQGEEAQHQDAQAPVAAIPKSDSDDFWAQPATRPSVTTAPPDQMVVSDMEVQPQSPDTDTNDDESDSSDSSSEKVDIHGGIQGSPSMEEEAKRKRELIPGTWLAQPDAPQPDFTEKPSSTKDRSSSVSSKSSKSSEDDQHREEDPNHLRPRQDSDFSEKWEGIPKVVSTEVPSAPGSQPLPLSAWDQQLPSSHSQSSHENMSEPKAGPGEASQPSPTTFFTAQDEPSSALEHEPKGAVVVDAVATHSSRSTTPPLPLSSSKVLHETPEAPIHSHNASGEHTLPRDSSTLSHKNSGAFGSGLFGSTSSLTGRGKLWYGFAVEESEDLTSIVIREVTFLGPAYNGGLRSGDKLASFAGQPIFSLSQFLNLLENSCGSLSGKGVKFGIIRDGKAGKPEKLFFDVLPRYTSHVDHTSPRKSDSLLGLKEHISDISPKKPSESLKKSDSTQAMTEPMDQEPAPPKEEVSPQPPVEPDADVASVSRKKSSEHEKDKAADDKNDESSKDDSDVSSKSERDSESSSAPSTPTAAATEPAPDLTTTPSFEITPPAAVPDKDTPQEEGGSPSSAEEDVPTPIQASSSRQAETATPVAASAPIEIVVPTLGFSTYEDPDHFWMIVTNVQPEGPAYASGLCEHDVLTHFAGFPVPNQRLFLDALRKHLAPNKPVRLQIIRDDETAVISIMPREPALHRKNSAPAGSSTFADEVWENPSLAKAISWDDPSWDVPSPQRRAAAKPAPSGYLSSPDYGLSFRLTIDPPSPGSSMIDHRSTASSDTTQPGEVLSEEQAPHIESLPRNSTDEPVTRPLDYTSEPEVEAVFPAVCFPEADKPVPEPPQVVEESPEEEDVKSEDNPEVKKIDPRDVDSDDDDNDVEASGKADSSISSSDERDKSDDDENSESDVDSEEETRPKPAAEHSSSKMVKDEDLFKATSALDQAAQEPQTSQDRRSSRPADLTNLSVVSASSDTSSSSTTPTPSAAIVVPAVSSPKKPPPPPPAQVVIAPDANAMNQFAVEMWIIDNLVMGQSPQPARITSDIVARLLIRWHALSPENLIEDTNTFLCNLALAIQHVTEDLRGEKALKWVSTLFHLIRTLTSAFPDPLLIHVLQPSLADQPSQLSPSAAATSSSLTSPTRPFPSLVPTPSSSAQAVSSSSGGSSQLTSPALTPRNTTPGRVARNRLLLATPAQVQVLKWNLKVTEPHSISVVAFRRFIASLLGSIQSAYRKWMEAVIQDSEVVLSVVMATVMQSRRGSKSGQAGGGAGPVDGSTPQVDTSPLDSALSSLVELLRHAEVTSDFATVVQRHLCSCYDIILYKLLLKHATQLCSMNGAIAFKLAMSRVQQSLVRAFSQLRSGGDPRSPTTKMDVGLSFSICKEACNALMLPKSTEWATPSYRAAFFSLLTAGDLYFLLSHYQADQLDPVGVPPTLLRAFEDKSGHPPQVGPRPFLWPDWSSLANDIVTMAQQTSQRPVTLLEEAVRDLLQRATFPPVIKQNVTVFQSLAVLVNASDVLIV